MSPDLKTIAQILVLSVGVHVVFSFLRTTRGSGMIRGVLIALFVVFGALLGAARWFDLAELEYIVEGVTGFAVVILAIVFQPELRRGIISLGENPLVRRVIGSRSGDVVDEVAGACVSMAKRKQGALIAFEREAALDPWAQTAQRVDARVNRFLLDSIFNTSSALHDGAVIIREDRIAAAGAILPLSENENLAQSVGTRHRAALGLSEETDAVVVAVSEETGLITVCQDGKMERRVLRDELAGVLRARLGGGEDVASKDGHSFVGAVLGWPLRAARALVQNPTQKLLAFAFGVALYFVAFRSVRTTEQFTVEVRAVAGIDVSLQPRPGVLRIVLPSEDLQLVTPSERRRIQVSASAPQAELQAISRGLGGVLVVEEDWIDQDRELTADAIGWGLDRILSGIDVELVSPESFRLRVERYARATIVPDVAAVLSATPSGAPRLVLPASSELDMESLEFDPSEVTLRGPTDAIARIVDNPALLVFEPVDLTREVGSGFVVRLRPVEAQGVTLGDELFLRGRVLQRETTVGQMELDVALVSFRPDMGAPGARYLPPTETVTVLVKGRGLVPDTFDPEVQTVMRQEIIRFVRENARVFVDVERMGDARTNRADVEVGSLDPLWRASLGGLFLTAKNDPNATLRLEIDEADRTVALVKQEDGDKSDD